MSNRLLEIVAPTGVLEKKKLEILYDDYQNTFSFHEDYWTWEKTGGFLIVRKK